LTAANLRFSIFGKSLLTPAGLPIDHDKI